MQTNALQPITQRHGNVVFLNWGTTSKANKKTSAPPVTRAAKVRKTDAELLDKIMRKHVRRAVVEAWEMLAERNPDETPIWVDQLVSEALVRGAARYAASARGATVT